MAGQEQIDVGSVANDGTGDTLRAAFQKSNSNATDTLSKSETTTQSVASNVSFPTGKGIEFEDLLEHYEEGNWTPTISGLVLDVRSATYTRIGRMVTIQAVLLYTSGTGSGFYVGGLPFSANYYAGFPVTIGAWAYLDCDGVVPSAMTTTDQLLFRGITNNAAARGVDFSTFTSNSALSFACTYEIG